MTDLAVAFGLVLVLEGLLWTLVPDVARRNLEAVAGMAPETVKLLGTAGCRGGRCRGLDGARRISLDGSLCP